MEKDNYAAWNMVVGGVTPSATDNELLPQLLKFAVLAPSSHNSQPWKFVIREKNTISVITDKERMLPVSDANNRQLYISLGCAIENILVAADYYGFNATVRYAPASGRVADITLNKTGRYGSSDTHPIVAIPKRRTNRNKYLERVPADDILSDLCAHATPDIEMHMVADTQKKNALADIVLSALGEAMDDPAFRAELSRYVRPNTTRSFIGMPGTGLGMPTPVSYIAPALIKYVNIHKLARKQEESLLKRYTPVFGIISTAGDTPQDWIQAGRCYQYTALRAEMNDLKTAVMAAAIQIKDYYKELQAVLSTDNRPQVFFRLGYCDKAVPPSPRLPAASVTDFERS